MDDSMSGWDWVSGINALALGWFSALRGDPLPPPVPPGGGSVVIGGNGIAFNLGTLVTIAAVVLLLVVLLRRR